jgi:hypothetical protein
MCGIFLLLPAEQHAVQRRTCPGFQPMPTSMSATQTSTTIPWRERTKPALHFSPCRLSSCWAAAGQSDLGTIQSGDKPGQGWRHRITQVHFSLVGHGATRTVAAKAQPLLRWPAWHRKDRHALSAGGASLAVANSRQLGNRLTCHSMHLCAAELMDRCIGSPIWALMMRDKELTGTLRTAAPAASMSLPTW